MKTLLFALLFLSHSLWAQKEIINTDDGHKIASQIKDVEVTQMLNKTSEFKDCRDEYKFKADATDAEKSTNLQAAADCFKRKISEGNKSKEKLEELSETLNLSHYKLIKSKKAEDVQKYLNDKMYQAMTGVDPSESDLKKLQEDLKFNKKKHIDQATFFKLYRMQLGKNALFEISRFCFENLRVTGREQITNFADHWKDYSAIQGTNLITQSNNTPLALNDKGDPKFGTIQDPTDKKQIYQDIFKSFQNSSGNGLDSTLLDNFFEQCGTVIVPLCKAFETTLNLDKTQSKTSINSAANGANACLAKARLQEFRKAITMLDNIYDHQSGKLKDFMSNSAQMSLALSGEPIKIYGDGSDPKEKNEYELTNFDSSTMLGNEDANQTKELEECQSKGTLDKCQDIFSDKESFEKAKHKTELEMTLRREVEMERVKKIVNQNQQDIKTYLKENGYEDILKEYNEGKLKSADDLSKRVGQAFEAKKIALLAQLNSKMSKRQVDPNTPTIDPNKIGDVIDETKEERARLAQVVLFNNIIASRLSLKNDKDETVGTNIGIWNAEEAELTKSQIDPNLFKNLQSNQGQSGTSLDKGENLDYVNALESFLGAPPKQ